MSGFSSLKVIITGATGMVGEGVLLECLGHPAVAQVLSVSRKPCGITHDKLRECLVADFLDLNGIADQLTGYDACFFCAGISSVGMDEAQYTRITYDVTLNFARQLLRPGSQMSFVYVSGAQTDSSEKGSVMWARVKGRTENALQTVGFRKAYSFRPGAMRATPGQRHLKWYYTALSWLYPLLRVTLPNHVSTLQVVGRAMINAARTGYPKQVLEVKDINALGAAP
jgi:NAD dependent epimerase/dehydratase family